MSSRFILFIPLFLGILLSGCLQGPTPTIEKTDIATVNDLSGAYVRHRSGTGPREWHVVSRRSDGTYGVTRIYLQKDNSAKKSPEERVALLRTATRHTYIFVKTPLTRSGKLGANSTYALLETKNDRLIIRNLRSKLESKLHSKNKKIYFNDDLKKVFRSYGLEVDFFSNRTMLRGDITATVLSKLIMDKRYRRHVKLGNPQIYAKVPINDVPAVRANQVSSTQPRSPHLPRTAGNNKPNAPRKTVTPAIREKARIGKDLFAAKQYRSAAPYLLEAAKGGDVHSQFLAFKLVGNPSLWEHLQKNKSKRPKPRDYWAIRYYEDRLRKMEEARQKVSGILLPQDGLRWLGEAAKAGHIGALDAYGYQVFYGSKYLPKNHKAGLKFTRIAAKSGHPRSMSRIGWAYLKGLGVKKNIQASVNWYKQAAAKNFKPAIDRLISIYGDGTEIPVNLTQRFRYALIAAKMGDPYGQFLAGWHYHKGIGPRKNQREAIMWTLKAAKGGYPTAYTNLGFYLERGYGFRKNWKEAFKYYAMAATRRDGQGAYNLASIAFDRYKLGADRYLKKIKIDGKPQSLESLALFAKSKKVEGADGLLRDIRRVKRVTGAIVGNAAKTLGNILKGDSKALDKQADDMFRAIDKVLQQGERKR